MPPRLPSGSAATVANLETALSQTTLSSSTSSLTCRTFSSTPQLSGTAQRRWKMHQWLKGRGGAIWNAEAQTIGNGPRLAGPMSNQPFPLNPLFKSEPVLSEPLRKEIHRRITTRGKVKKQAYLAVSREFGIDVRRVAAVVRLMEVEKVMVEQKQELATPYAKVLNSWLPQTPYQEDNPIPHEPINEITVHPSTQKQLFVPTSESRTFTREDAAKAFHDKLLSADDRSFAKSVIAMERKVHGGASRSDAIEAFNKDQIAREHWREMRERQKTNQDRKTVKVVMRPRAQVRIRDVKTNEVGKNGRRTGTVGWRYGVPHMDRKRGAVKIPTEVPSQRTAPQQ